MGKKKILIVEDEPNLRTMLAVELETAGYEVYQAEDGVVALDMTPQVKPDLIVSDVLMPHMDGNQLMKRLRASDFGRGIPFIVLTARGQMQDYFELMEADDFIAKPFEAEDLLLRIEKVLSKPKKRPAAGPAATLSTKKKVLILDDDIAVQQALQKALIDQGYEVYLAGSVSEFLDTAVKLKPHVIVLNSALAEMKADKLIGIVKGMTDFKKTPFLVYTARAAAGEEKDVLMAGASRFIAEMDADKVVNAAGEILKGHD